MQTTEAVPIITKRFVRKFNFITPPFAVEIQLHYNNKRPRETSCSYPMSDCPSGKGEGSTDSEK